MEVRMKSFAVYSMKGGVGKTTAAVNVAYLAAELGCRTVLWDLDPQGSATFYLSLKPRLKSGTGKLVKGKTSIADSVTPTGYDNLDAVPSDFRIRNLDLRLDAAKKPTTRLAAMLGDLADGYELAVLDCPPSISLVSENVVRAADCVVVPLIPSTLSVQSFATLRDHLAAEGIPAERLIPFFSMVDGRKRLHRTILQETLVEDTSFCRTYIPYLSTIEKMGTHRAPVPCFAGTSRATRAFRDLWREIASRIA